MHLISQKIKEAVRSQGLEPTLENIERYLSNSIPPRQLGSILNGLKLDFFNADDIRNLSIALEIDESDLYKLTEECMGHPASVER